MKLHENDSIKDDKDDGVAFTLGRRLVPGGWLYTSHIAVAVDGGAAVALSTTFVPDEAAWAGRENS